MKIVLLIPVFDDWESATLLCDLIDSTFQQHGSYRASILFVDDGSVTSAVLAAKPTWKAIQEIQVLHLRRNLGHQRAIAVGLAYVEHHKPCDVVVVMDSDGEDLPQDIPALLGRAADTPGRVVFAERGRRVEGRVFRSMYLVYRAYHRLLTGRGIRFGNFSVVPFRVIKRLTSMSELWGHYAATVVNAKIPYVTMRVDRGPRLLGRSKMDLESLIMHGLSAVAVYQTASVRALMACAVLSGFLALAVLALAVIRFATALTIPNWTTAMLGGGLIVIFLITFGSMLYVFASLSFRHLMGMLPTRDYIYFVDRCDQIYPE